MYPISVSQTKQIAGRAGRFGLHTLGSVGEVTTLYQHDLRTLEHSMATENPTVDRAVLSVSDSQIHFLASSISGTKAGLQDAFSVFSQLALPGLIYAPRSYARDIEAMDIMEKLATSSPLNDVSMFLAAPIRWRELNEKKDINTGIKKLLKDYFVELKGDLDGLVESCGGYKMLEDANELVTESMAAITPPAVEAVEASTAELQDPVPTDSASISSPPTTLEPTPNNPRPIDQDAISSKARAILKDLEPIHQLVITYLWLSYRRPLVFKDQARAFKVKAQVEHAIDNVLSIIQTGAKQGDLGVVQEVKSMIPIENTVLGSPASFDWEYLSSDDGFAPRHARVGPRRSEIQLPF